MEAQRIRRCRHPLEGFDRHALHNEPPRRRSAGVVKRGGSPTSATSGKAPKTYEDGRVCGQPTCFTRLSRYNADEHCFLHSSALVKVGRG
jgi:hypothetical protein